VPEPSIGAITEEQLERGAEKNMVIFQGSELVKVAVNIERIGATFYDTLASKAKDASGKAVFKNLADMERDHEKTFSKLLERGSTVFEPFESYPEEYTSYMKALAESAVFPDQKTALDLARKVATQADALELGIRAEKDSILFYAEMRRTIREREQATIDAIIEEEKAHLRQLLEMKRRANG
jgi:rubrerythrin